ncbi:DUF6519 domain-containing protein [Primorskyibacter sp. 2E107]|uniref:DUF6519 domain-containing protein n=1 Tax=Primorskyibacter sp. 2E107 TaxID=3403458 RepID=UPI003AF65D64
MATRDHTVSRFDPRINTRGIEGQTGRVITDEDLTLIGQVTSEEAAQDRIGIIGPHGTSDHGFRISAATIANGTPDFDIEAGNYWIGGLRAQLHETTTFRGQPDWLQNPAGTVAAGERIDMVWLEVWEQIVGATEDAAMVDPALGGVDTTARRRVMSRVHLAEDLDGDDCAEVWENLQQRWRDAGHGTVTALNELAGDGTLTTRFTGEGVTQNLCSPPVASGFLGAANRAIRVQMTGPDTFCWGFENGGRLLRALVTEAGRLTLLTDPVDAHHWPAPGQVVQVLPWGGVLDHGEKIADELAACHFTTVEAGYDPDEGTFTLTDPLPAGFGDAWLTRPDADALRLTKYGTSDAQGAFVFVRIWDRGEDRSAPELDATLPQVLGDTGIEVTLAGTTLRRGDSWEIAARPSAPDEIIPWELDVGRAYGPYRRYVAPLARILWHGRQGSEIIDCRRRFRPLTRMGDCITLRVGDGTHSFGDYEHIQQAVEALRHTGGKILVLPGVYEERVELYNCHDITIEGCKGRTRVIAPDGDDTPVFHLRDSRDITLRDLTIDAPRQLAVLATRSPNGKLGTARVRLESLSITHFQHGGIMMFWTQDLTISGCSLFAEGSFVPGVRLPDITHRPGLYAQGKDITIRDTEVLGRSPDTLTTALGGIQIGGGSEDVLIERCAIAGSYGHGITLGSVSYVPDFNTVSIEQSYSAHGTTAVVSHDFWLSANNCFGIDPGRHPENPEGGADLLPISDGPIESMVIRDCEILGMGGCGISVAMYFDFDANPDFITTNDLEIRNCRIQGNLLGENVAYPEQIRAVAAYGGITLGDVAGLDVRDNRIEDNGLEDDTPKTGVFVLFGEGLSICDNTIRANGRRADQTDSTPSGWRGGVVIGQVRPLPQVDAISDTGVRSDGGQALRVTGNTIVAPQGRAVTGFGLGPMMVSNNRLTTQSGGTDSWLPALSGIGVAPQKLNLGIILGAALIVALQQGRRPNALSGHGILTALGGEVVALGNTGFSSELYLQAFGLSGALVQGEDAAFDYDGTLLAGGDIQLNDNQIRLDGQDSRAATSVSAVVAASLDSVMIQSNQIALDVGINDFVAINALALGWTVHVSANRLKEPIFNALLSALTLGLMNTTTANQATHCVLAFGPAAMRVDSGNTELIEAIFNQDIPICGRLRQGMLGLQTFGQTMQPVQ